MRSIDTNNQLNQDNASDIEFINAGLQVDTDIQSVPLSNSGLIAGTFDALGIEQIIETYIGKVGSHVKVSSGAIVKALVMQLLAVPYQSLYGTSEYFKDMPVDKLLNTNITYDDLNRHTLSRLLDDVDAFGPEKLYLHCAKAACDAFNIKVTDIQLDSTSFHYDGQTREEEGCNLVLKKGYSRDHRAELNQVVMLGIADGISKLPLFFKSVSGNINDKTSFRNVLIDHFDDLKEQFKDLKYLIADSALCTNDNFNMARAKGIHVITRVVDSSEVFKKLTTKYTESDLEPIYENDDCHVFGKFCGTDIVAGQRVKLLLISNMKMRKQKTETINRRASKELEDINKKFKKLFTQPKKCMEDAVAEVDKIASKLKYCSIDNVIYTKVEKNATKGRPAKNKEVEKKLDCVKVTASISINEEAVSKAIANELMFVIATTDTKRKWKMHELYSCYMRQSVIERKWRICKKPSIMIDAIYLKSPRRINALMWIMSIALLIYAATELKIRASMQENNLSIPTPDHKNTMNKPTLDRFNQYIGNLKITLIIDAEGKTYISGLSRPLAHILIAMGEHWLKYFRAEFYINR